MSSESFRLSERLIRAIESQLALIPDFGEVAMAVERRGQRRIAEIRTTIRRRYQERAEEGLPPRT